MTKTVSGTTTIEAQYGYDPYGIATKLQGSQDGDFQYAGYYMHARSGLNLPVYRAYSSSLGRFINRDPIGEDGGVNLYVYVSGNPVLYIDPSGLWDAQQFNQTVQNYAAAGAVAGMIVGGDIGGTGGGVAGAFFGAGVGAIPGVAVGTPAGAAVGSAIGATAGGLIGAGVYGGNELINMAMGGKKFDPEDGDGNRTPRGNQRQNRSYKDAIREIERQIGRKLTKDERQRLHNDITKQGFDYHGVLERGLEMFGCP